MPVISALSEVGAEGLEAQGHPWLPKEFEDSLGYLRP